MATIHVMPRVGLSYPEHQKEIDLVVCFDYVMQLASISLEGQSVQEQADKIREWLEKNSPLLETFTSNELVLTQNRGHFKEVPPEIRFFTHLTHFYLLGCKLQALAPEIGALSRLEALSLRDNQLITLPSAIGNLKELMTRKWLVMSN